MKSQKLKDIYFTAIRPLARINGWRWYIQNRLMSSHADQALFLNLGCGNKYLKGFINIEGNIYRKKDMWLDLRNGLPYPAQSVNAIYSCHIFEHFYLDELIIILKECHRVLKLGGGIRILVPSLEKAISAYVAKQVNWFPGFPSSYQSIGGRFFNYIFCDSQHRLAFDFSFFNELLQSTGFRLVVPSEPVKSELIPYEMLNPAEQIREGYIRDSLIIETWKQQD